MSWDLEDVHAEIDELQRIFARLHWNSIGQVTYGAVDALDRLHEIDRQIWEVSLRISNLRAASHLPAILGQWHLADRDRCRQPVRRPTMRESFEKDMGDGSGCS